jgi:uncharacterized membrane protein
MSTGIARDSAGSVPREAAPERGARRPPLRAVLAMVACVTYPFLVYWVITQRHRWAGLALVLAALICLCLNLPRPRWAILGLLIAMIAAVALLPMAATPALLFLPPLCINFGLAWFFGRTLAPGREALITRFAKMQHADTPPEIEVYTRRLTFVWTLFFLTMAAVSGGLAAVGAHAVWAWFTAVGNYLCVAALFAMEYLWRRWRYPREDHVGPLQQVLMMRRALRERSHSS